MTAAVIDLFSKQEVPVAESVLRAVPSPSPGERVRPEEDALVAEFLERYDEGTRSDYARDIRYWREFLSLSESGLYSARTPEGTGWATFEVDVNERKPRTVRRYLSTVSSLYRYANGEGYHDRNPVQNVRRPQILTNVQYLGPDLKDLGRLAEHLRWERDLRLRAVVMVLMTTGLRVSELCTARVEKLFTRDGKAWLPVVRKGGYPDEVELPRVTVEALHAYLAGREHGPVILGDHGGAMSRKVVWREVHRLGASVLPHLPEGLHPHDFRHGFTTAVLMLTGEITEAQWRAGHRDIRTTMGYVHALKAQDSATPDRLEELFGLGLG